MSCPWSKIPKPETVNLQEIMLEEATKDLQTKEEYSDILNLLKDYDIINTTDNKLGLSEILPTTSTTTTLEEEFGERDTNNCNSDELIAQMLQIQFDKELDTSKVSISFENYERMPSNADDYEIELDDEDNSNYEEEVEDIHEIHNWDNSNTLQCGKINSTPSYNYKTQKDYKSGTKHDITITGRKNASKLLSLPEFQTENGELLNLKLSHKVFNSLKTHSRHKQTKPKKVINIKTNYATAEFQLYMDKYTHLTISKLIKQELIKNVDSVIGIGKEAVVLHGNYTKPNDNNSKTYECALKIFNTSFSQFKQRDTEVTSDYPLNDCTIGNWTTKKPILLWAEKEMNNLNCLKRAQVPCPDVITLKRHVLVMSFIGDNNNKPAQKLGDSRLELNEYILAYEQVIEGMRDMYTKANLIHGDLSELNILWYKNQCYFIDVSQAVEPTHQNAFYFLMRDCKRVIQFFSKVNVSEILEPSELFASITGFSYNDKLKLAEMQKNLIK